ncbi:winged helix-turn-helix domain-containing protein [Dyella halodurans]|uniref:Helix-turn-helix domain-containing protein n=1 Tax=Dyella halodurans TaxID=1920171 RepID=A0ABV9C247_9GAMM|nr:helix-turn-helix domain-containing protein [Dyella halodurans]
MSKRYARLQSGMKRSAWKCRQRRGSQANVGSNRALASTYLDKLGVLRYDGIHLGLKTAQDQLADFVGCSRPFLNRELKQLEKELAIQVTFSKIVVRDEHLLTSIVIDG